MVLRQNAFGFDMSTGRLNVYVTHDEKDGTFSDHIYKFEPVLIEPMTPEAYADLAAEVPGAPTAR
jgi:hypothetical protein